MNGSMCRSASRRPAADSGILIRTCRGRKDYTGGRNNFAPLRCLDNIEALAGFCERVLDREGDRS